ncbi:MAG: citrate synthase [Planctomycetota bacterium]|jgi:citrate synthase
MAENSLKITDNRTGKEYTVPIENNTIRAKDLNAVKLDEKDFGLMAYDPGYVFTASCKSEITFIDGAGGILQYRGHPIQDLAENATFLEVAHRLLYGNLPTRTEYDSFVNDVTHHTFVHENMKKVFDGFHHDAHPMGTLVSSVAALSTFYPDAKGIGDEENRRLQTIRLIAKMPTLAAWAYRHSRGLPYVSPDNELTYTQNFGHMMFRMTEQRYKAHPVMEKALDVLFILHADHEQNCSASAMRNVGSSHVDPYSSVAAAAAALYGPLHGGANEAVLRMLREIGSVDRIPKFLERVKNREVKLMGFGHRVYKNYDPRAKIIKQIADEVFEVTGRNPLLDIALELERIALSEDYFIEKKLYPNVDFYSGLIYQAMAIPVDMFPVMFAIGRTAGWLSQWAEMVTDPEQRIARPRQIYLGERDRGWVPMNERG